MIEESTIQDCLVYNSAECGIRLAQSGSDPNGNITIDGCQVYCDDDSTPNSSNSGTDYYVDVDASSNTSVTYCHVERIGGLFHGGHGFAIQGRNANLAKNNTFLNCTSVNIDEPFILRGAGVQLSLFEQCTSTIATPYSDESVENQRRPHGGIVLDGGPENNRFNRIRLNKATQGIKYGIVSGGSSTHTGQNNWFENSIFDIQRYETDMVQNPEYNGNPATTQNLGVGIKVRPTSGALKVEYETYVNCTFHGGNAFIAGDHIGDDNVVTNTIIQNFDEYESHFDRDDLILTGTFDHGFSITTSCIFPVVDFPLHFRRKIAIAS